MTDSIITFINYLRKKDLVEDIDFLKKASEFMYQQLIDLEAEEVIGAGRYERTPKRQTHRNGTRERQLETRVGEITVKIPKLRRGSYFPSILEPRDIYPKSWTRGNVHIPVKPASDSGNNRPPYWNNMTGQHIVHQVDDMVC